MTIECPKCGHENEPSGLHEEDSGEWECYECEFKFTVLVEYDPCYTVSCVTHEWGEFKATAIRRGGTITGRWCGHCGAYDLKQEAKQ